MFQNQGIFLSNVTKTLEQPDRQFYNSFRRNTHRTRNQRGNFTFHSGAILQFIQTKHLQDQMIEGQFYNSCWQYTHDTPGKWKVGALMAVFNDFQRNFINIGKATNFNDLQNLITFDIDIQDWNPVNRAKM